MSGNIPISLAMYKSTRLIKRYFERKKRQIGSDISTQNQDGIIVFIYSCRGKDVFQKDIEKEFGIRRSTATNTLQLMEKNGLIKRERVSHDERLKKITLTNEAFEVVHAVEKEMKKLNRVLESGITEEERKTFLRVLDKIRINIEEDDKDD